MIGLSLSFCIRDIIKNDIPLESIDKIICGTRAVTEHQWMNLILRYQETYWRDFPIRAAYFVSQLRAAGKLVQPRTTTGRAPMLATDSGLRYWVKDESEVQYC